MDEFQNISPIDEAETFFRDSMQNISNSIPVILLGSKKHLLANIFANHNSPLFNYGEDLEIGPIAYNEYHEYIMERFSPYKLTISEDDSQFIQVAYLEFLNQ